MEISYRWYEHIAFERTVGEVQIQTFYGGEGEFSAARVENRVNGKPDIPIAWVSNIATSVHRREAEEEKLQHAARQRSFQFNKTRILYLGGECSDPEARNSPNSFTIIKTAVSWSYQTFLSGSFTVDLHTFTWTTVETNLRWPYVLRWIYVNRRKIRVTAGKRDLIFPRVRT